MKLGVVGIIIERDRSVAEKVQTILSENADLIMGRMGIPDKDRGVYVISVIVRGTNERISALTGKLGKLENVKVKSAVTDSDD
ncbi:MAG TPA: CopG family transcriptional regulator [Clostridiales bacterium]|nr:CopG family transcriptional regulator [Clostridiales bacterium]